MHFDFFIPMWVIKTLCFLIGAPIVFLILFFAWMGYAYMKSNRY